jgi:NADH-quinone oxidoreductase subunit H
MAFIALPFGNQIVGRDMNIAILFILAVMSSEVFGIILIGYGSGSKWALFGGMREAAQMVSYEIPMALCILVPVIATGSMNLSQLSLDQRGIWNWNLFHDPFTFASFWLYYTCALASCKRAPFDLAEAESELVAGFHTEYSGFRWLIIFMAEYGSMFAVSGIAILVYLGGWSIGVPFELTDFFSFIPVLGWYLGNLLNVIVFILKGWFLVFVMMWIRWTLPRLRIDQVMMVCWKYIVPMGCALIVGVSFWVLLTPSWLQGIVRFCLVGATGFGVVAFILTILRVAHTEPGAVMPGMWRASGIVGFHGGKAPPTETVK